MSRESKLAKNTFIIAIGTFLPKFASLITLPILTGCLTKEEMGTYDLLTVLVSFLLPAATLQIQTAAFRFLIDVRHDKNEIKTIVTNIASVENGKYRSWDALLITLSLYRVLGNDLDTSTIIHNVNIETSCNDFDLLRRICEKKALVPTIKQEASIETGTFKRKTEKYYRDVKISDDTIRWFHINSILLLCDMLKLRCVFNDLGGAQNDGQSCAD